MRLVLVPTEYCKTWSPADQNFRELMAVTPEGYEDYWSLCQTQPQVMKAIIEVFQDRRSFDQKGFDVNCLWVWSGSDSVFTMVKLAMGHCQDVEMSLRRLNELTQINQRFTVETARNEELISNQRNRVNATVSKNNEDFRRLVISCTGGRT